MSAMVDGWDRDAAPYDAHWQPVLDGAARRLLDRVGEQPGPALVANGAPPPLVLDVGTGSGALLVAAAERWATARFVGLDPSRGMLKQGRRRARAAGLPRRGQVIRWLVGPAESMPLEDASVDVAISSFVLQLVEDRAAVLRELLRVIRPGGCLAFVTWIAQDMQIAPDDEFDEAVLDLEIAEPEPEPRPPSAGDFETLRQAERELRSAGFRHPGVVGDVLTHAWSRDAYLAFKEAYDERTLFTTLDLATRATLLSRVRERWATLPDEAFVLRAPLVSALARRP